MREETPPALSLTGGRANVLLMMMGLEPTLGPDGFWPPNICSLFTRTKSQKGFLLYLEATSESGTSKKRFLVELR